MEIVSVLAVALVIWWLFKRDKATSPVAQSALRNLEELDALGTELWLEFEETIEISDDRAELARAFFRGEKRKLPKEARRLWRRLDELTPEINQRAEHYERVSGRPAPPLQGRATSDRVVARLKDWAAGVELR